MAVGSNGRLSQPAGPASSRMTGIQPAENFDGMTAEQAGMDPNSPDYQMYRQAVIQGNTQEAEYARLAQTPAVKPPPPPQMMQNIYQNPWVAMGMALQGRASELVQGASGIAAANQRRVDQYRQEVARANEANSLNRQRLMLGRAEAIAKNAQNETSILSQIRARSQDLEHQKFMEGIQKDELQLAKKRDARAETAQQATLDQTKEDRRLKQVQYQQELLQLGFMKSDHQNAQDREQWQRQMGTLETFAKVDPGRKFEYDNTLDELSRMTTTEPGQPLMLPYTDPAHAGQHYAVPITEMEIDAREKRAIDAIEGAQSLTDDMKSVMIEHAHEKAREARTKHGFVVADKGYGPQQESYPRKTLVEQTPTDVGMSTLEQKTYEHTPDVKIRGTFDLIDRMTSMMSGSELDLVRKSEAADKSGVITTPEKRDLQDSLLRADIAGKIARVVATSVNDVTRDQYEDIASFLNLEIPGETDTKKIVSYLMGLKQNGRSVMDRRVALKAARAYAKAVRVARDREKQFLGRSRYKL